MTGVAITQPVGRKRTAALTLAALGVVFGDIGTSPLYTVKECFSDFTGLSPTHDNVVGILSLITWVLIIVVTLKYVVVVMRADNRGEGGVLALMALVSRQAAITERRRRTYLMIGVAGAALFYGDCLLTPAISVLSAVEGLKVATPALQPLVVPISLGVLVALFAVQHFGTAGVGRWFGPITLLWFIVLFVLGVRQIVEAPQVLTAFLPHHALEFALHHGFSHVPRPGRRNARSDRRGSALCRHGPFRPRTHPSGLAVAGAASAARQLLRPGRIAAHRRRAHSRTRSSASRRTGRSIRWWRSPPSPP